MIFLFANIVFGSSFVLILKWVQTRKREDIINVGAINYIVGALVSLPEFWSLDSYDQFSNADQMGAWISGATMGVCYFIAYFFVIYAIRFIGASTTNMISALSITMPIVFGIWLWSEIPSFAQIIGGALAIVALSIVGKSDSNAPSHPRLGYFLAILVGFFLLAGISRLSQDAFKHVSDNQLRPVFLFSAFSVASIPSIAILAWRRFKFSRMDFIFGIGLGLANILQSHFMLKALEHYEGYIVFPVVSAGGMIFIALVATLLLHEKMSRRAVAGISIATVALVLLNI